LAFFTDFFFELQPQHLHIAGLLRSGFTSGTRPVRAPR